MSVMALRTLLLAALLCITSLNGRAEEYYPSKVHFYGCTAEKTVFFAWTGNLKNAVEICKVKNGFRYSYGNIDKPEVRGTVKEMRAVKMSGKTLPAFVFTHDNISYWLNADKYGDAELMVTKGDWLNGTALDSISLETESMGYVNRVAEMLPFMDTSHNSGTLKQ